MVTSAVFVKVPLPTTAIIFPQIYIVSISDAKVNIENSIDNIFIFKLHFAETQDEIKITRQAQEQMEEIVDKPIRGITQDSETPHSISCEGFRGFYSYLKE